MHSLQGLPFVVEECLTCSVRREEAFCALSRKSLETFDRLKQEAAYREGVTLFMEGDAPHGVFMLCQGRVKLFVTFRDGRSDSYGSLAKEKCSVSTHAFQADRTNTSS